MMEIILVAAGLLLIVISRFAKQIAEHFANRKTEKVIKQADEDRKVFDTKNNDLIKKEVEQSVKEDAVDKKLEEVNTKPVTHQDIVDFINKMENKKK